MKRVFGLLITILISGTFFYFDYIKKDDNRSKESNQTAQKESGSTTDQEKEGEGCGVERWAVKTLTDQPSSQINFQKTYGTSITALSALPVPDGKTSSSEGRQRPFEFNVYQVNANLVSAKQEEDSDIHLVISQAGAANKTMIVEFPSSSCVGERQKSEMLAARNNFLKSCGPLNSSSFKDLSGTAKIRGVAFFDVIHGQRGVAPNGIELHPVLAFTGGCSS